MMGDTNKHSSCTMHPIGDEVFEPLVDHQALPKTPCNVELLTYVQNISYVCMESR